MKRGVVVPGHSAVKNFFGGYLRASSLDLDIFWTQDNYKKYSEIWRKLGIDLQAQSLEIESAFRPL